MGENDTIAAISTPPGEGGIAIVRLSGPKALYIADGIFSSSVKDGKKRKRPSAAKSHRMLYGFIADPATGEQVDEVLLSVMRAPNTYTREDMIEINCHGGGIPARKTLELVLNGGARLAEPGEFTKRAFLNGRIDLSQAEAVLELIQAKSAQAEKLALEQLSGGLSGKINAVRDGLADICAHMEAYLDFPEEGIEEKTEGQLKAGIEQARENLLALSRTYEEGRLIREGLKTAIAGRANVGKSSLLNALLGQERAIVTPLPGTTRDVISEYINIGGFALRIMDTAGIRRTEDIAEMEGVRRSRQAIEGADLVICVLDGSARLTDEDREVLEAAEGKKRIVAVNKADLPRAWRPGESGDCISVSAKTGAGLEALKERIRESFTSRAKDPAEAAPGAIITSLRHKTALERAAQALERGGGALSDGMPLEVVSIELRDALDALGEITGMVTTEDILRKIFDEFCIGK
ncbi:MAG: tRNA uridine-5-carboxymethylaminomethyl(34) synthesis GTPase MnmE [Nitrospiraceae bacterium]|nr:tRNA uridine-5-carboxymethylaminomethyl(34) synthesis GTPase MnmE [Nitrospiraceae bacterium]